MRQNLLGHELCIVEKQQGCLPPPLWLLAGSEKAENISIYDIHGILPFIGWFDFPVYPLLLTFWLNIYYIPSDEGDVRFKSVPPKYVTLGDGVRLEQMVGSWSLSNRLPPLCLSTWS